MKAPIAQSSRFDREAFPVNEAGQLLGISRTSIYELAKRNELALIKIAGRTLVPRSEIERLTSAGTR